MAAISIFYSNSTLKVSWTLPSDLLHECIDIIISTNASTPSSIINSSVIITRPAEDPADTIYTLSVATMDKAERIGEQSETLCFRFECESKAVLYSCNIHTYYPIAPRILEVLSDNICNSTISIQWTVKVYAFSHAE